MTRMKDVRLVVLSLVFLASMAVLPSNALGGGNALIAYNKPDPDLGGGGFLNPYNDIWVINADGTGDTLLPLACLSCPFSTAEYPTWSRDGRQFVFTALLPASGYAMVDWLLTTNELVLVAPLGTAFGGLPAAFSSDGRQLAYEDFNLNFNDFRVINVDGSNPRDVTPLGVQGNAFGVDWSPARNVLVFPIEAFCPSPNEQLVLAPPVNNGIALAVPLTQPPCILGVRISDVFPAFSPNGAQVAYARWVDQTPIGGPFWTELHVINADGTSDRLVRVFTGEVVVGISWSPDGSSLVFDRGFYPVAGSNGLWILDGGLRRLQSPPAWAPSWDAPSELREALKSPPTLVAKAGFCHSTVSVADSSQQSARSKEDSTSGELPELVRGRFKHQLSHPWPVEPANLDICKRAH